MRFARAVLAAARDVPSAIRAANSVLMALTLVTPDGARNVSGEATLVPASPCTVWRIALVVIWATTGAELLPCNAHAPLASVVV